MFKISRLPEAKIIDLAFWPLREYRFWLFSRFTKLNDFPDFSHSLTFFTVHDSSSHNTSQEPKSCATYLDPSNLLQEGFELSHLAYAPKGYQQEQQCLLTRQIKVKCDDLERDDAAGISTVHLQALQSHSPQGSIIRSSGQPVLRQSTMSSSDPFSQLPFSPSIPVKPYKIHIPAIEVEKFTSLIHLSPLPSGPPLTSITNPLLPTGALSPSYLAQCRDDFLHSLEHAWRTHESHFNSYPNFLANIQHENHIYDIHFLALFSQNKTTTPETLVFLHGYPSSAFSFLPILDLLLQKYTPETLPFHVLIPSLPGFGFSSPPPDPQTFSIEQAGQLIDSLLRGLGLKPYTISANDLGSFIARKIYTNEKSGCTALHLSMIPPPPHLLNPTTQQTTQPENSAETLCLHALKSYTSDQGSIGMNLLQGQRPGLIGLVAGTHPLGVLGWVGVRIWEWSDTSSLDHELFENIHAKVLQTTALYFLTQTLQSCLWFSREMLDGSVSSPTGDAGTKRGVGYSLFMRDIVPTPESWALETLRGEMGIRGFRLFRRHERGGHFACWEVPELLLGDVEEFVGGLRG